MRTYAIIDIGSNTVRMNLYQVKDENFSLLVSKKSAVGLASYVKKKVMSQEGIDALIECLLDFRRTAQLLNIDVIDAFATASLRNIKNTEDVLNQVSAHCQIQIEILSGAQEGLISFDGALLGIHYDDGMYMDTGGGSSEIVLYDQKRIGFVCSLPVGSLNLFNEYVDRIISTKSEITAIQDRVKQELKSAEPSKGMFRVNNLVVTGGSMRAIRELMVHLKMVDPNNFVIKPDDLSELIKVLSKDEKETIRLFLKVKADRVHTMFPGLLLIQSVAQYSRAKNIQVSTNGVREGYMIDKVLKHA